VASFFSHTLSE
jgi:hypothetical protein